MKGAFLALAALSFAACSSLPDAGDGVVALQVYRPDSLFVLVGGSVKLRAVALDIHGDSVAAQIFWRTPDTAFVTLDSVTGTLVGKSVGTARVQARVGTLTSDPLGFGVRPDTTSTGIRGRP